MAHGILQVIQNYLMLFACMAALHPRLSFEHYVWVCGQALLHSYPRRCIQVSCRHLDESLNTHRFEVNIHPIITTVLGILVGFSLNLRSSTAYERYMEGRKIWSHLNSVSTSIARNVWIHAEERDGDLGKQDLLSKISFLNLIIAFSVALKHKLRFEPYIQYNDLQDLVSHLDTFAKDAGSPTVQERKTGLLRQLATLLHIAQENPRSEIKRAKRPIGNLPLEILSYMSAYLKHVCDNGTMKMASMESKALNDLKSMDDIIVTSDRILNTPLPIAYTIAISQITWVYVIALPFQLTHLMGWITIPTTTLAAYIILGFAAIGNEIENPFGLEVGDLPLEAYCAQIASDITIISSKPPPKPEEYLTALENRPLYPISSANLRWWPGAATEDIRDALKTRAMLSKPAMWRKQSVWKPFHREESVGGSTLNSETMGRQNRD